MNPPINIDSPEIVPVNLYCVVEQKTGGGVTGGQNTRFVREVHLNCDQILRFLLTRKIAGLSAGFFKDSKGSRSIRKSAKVVTMSLEGGPLVAAWGGGPAPPPPCSDSLGVRT